jgi:hypothetical protein
MTAGRLSAQLSAAAERLGWPGVLGLGLLAFAAGFYFSSVRPAQQGALERRAEALRLEQRREREPKEAAPLSARQQLGKFYGFFPSADHASAPLGRIFGVAEQHALQLREGEYRVMRSGTDGLARYQLRFPVRGSYPQLRRFVAAALGEVPNLALDSIQFERKKVGESVANAKVTFVMYLGRER